MAATTIVHIVHDHAHYRPVVRHPAFVANRSAAGGFKRLLERYGRLGQREYHKIFPQVILQDNKSCMPDKYLLV